MPLFTPNANNLMRDVYSYPFPEVREIINGIQLDAAFMLNTLPVDEAAGYLHSYGFEPVLDLPARMDGTLDHDELHVPVIDRIRERMLPMLPGLDSFAHAYPTPDSSSALFSLMAEKAACGELTRVATLHGEYDGYAAYAQTLHVPLNQYAVLPQTPPKDGEVWFVSNPSARDGNFIDQQEWSAFVAAGHQIVYDAAYMGLTAENPIDVSAPNILAVLTSPSKIFGVFRYRNTGVAYTRKGANSLFGTKWFKDIPALLDTLKLYESFGSDELADRYRPRQEAICATLGTVVGSEVLPSDVLLLARAAGPVDVLFEPYRRVAGYRFGLAKLFEDYERMVQT